MPRLPLSPASIRPAVFSPARLTLFPFTSSRSPVPIPRNNMSLSTSTSRKEFLCIIPDYPGSVAKRMEVRPKHLEEIKPLVQDGSVVLGGGMFDAHPSEDSSEPPSFNGSAMIVLAESAEHVRRLMAADIYATAGVWDVEKASVIPFKSAVREAL